jgi:hypothetical protein
VLCYGGSCSWGSAEYELIGKIFWAVFPIMVFFSFITILLFIYWHFFPPKPFHKYDFGCFGTAGSLDNKKEKKKEED